MAHMIPDEPPGSGGGAKAERAVYEALEAQLPGDFFVYHGLRFVEGETAREGEADFLVLHRELGMLALECKGSGVKRTGTGAWVRTVDGAEEPLRKNPFKQVEDTINHLVRTLEPRLAHELSWRGPFPFAFGHAVVFPLALAAEANLPLDAPREILMDASDLSRLGERVRAALAFWGRKRPAGAPLLDKKDFIGSGGGSSTRPSTLRRGCGPGWRRTRPGWSASRASRRGWWRPSSTTVG